MNTAFPAREGLLYGLLGLPLAFVALPLYVILPNHYAREFGMPLATLGTVLLGARLFDAVIDPLLGRWSDRLYARSTGHVLAWGALAALLLAAGFTLLFFPPTRTPDQLVLWSSGLLVLTYAAFSALGVMHQSWGAMLGGDEAQRGRIVAWREGWGLVGVVLASIIPAVLGMSSMIAAFLMALMAGWLAWSRAARPVRPVLQPLSRVPSLWRPFQQPAFKRLLAVFMVNGVASALPATLLLFFVQDRLQAPPHMAPVFLGSYFLCAALSMPLWLALVRRIGLARSWLTGMGLSMAMFVWAAGLGAGDSTAFVVVCALSGLALGSDLALPGALLAGIIAEAGDRGQAEGAYFGWWNFATKLNLALAAGLALPLLSLLGYTPGTRDETALWALTGAYCLLPVLLKLLAAGLLHGLLILPSSDSPISKDLP
jgi:GPH family glycoside/pentoside/hexuronide:cation symporter